MKTLILMVGISLVAPSVLQAQSALRDELNQEIDMLYPKVKPRKKPVRIEEREIVTKEVVRSEEAPVIAQSDLPPAPAPSVTVTNSNLNLNNNTSKATAESAAKSETASKSVVIDTEAARSKRADVERATEVRLVEKLEEDRIRAEKERAEKAAIVFAEKERESKIQVNTNNGTVVNAPVVNAPAVSTPALVIAEPTPAPLPPVRIEVVKDPSEKLAADEKSVLKNLELETLRNERPKNLYYVSGLAGVGSYDSVNNVRGIFSFGFTAGAVIDSFAIEGSYIRSSYDMAETFYCAPGYYYNCGMPVYGQVYNIQMDQNMVNLAGKYVFFRTSSINPYIGGSFAYSWRKFQNRMNPNITYPDSGAFDIGAIGGLNVRVSNSFTIGGDVKWFNNISYRRESFTYSPYYTYSPTMKPIEEYSYWNFGVTGSFTF